MSFHYLRFLWWVVQIENFFNDFCLQFTLWKPLEMSNKKKILFFHNSFSRRKKFEMYVDDSFSFIHSKQTKKNSQTFFSTISCQFHCQMMMLGSNEKNFHSTIFFSGQRRNENNKVRDLIEF